MSDMLCDRALLVAVCEELVPFMNGSAMGRLTFLLGELASNPSGERLDATDREWVEDGLRAAASRRDWWQAELTRLNALGIDAIASLDPRYPTNLTLVHDGPPMLFVRGTLCDEDRRAVAVVGTREPSSEGLNLAQAIAKGLVAQGYTVVSGLAKGIDAAVHAATLNAGGRTIAVFGTPIETIYPVANRPLANRIAGTGACVSQFLPGVRTGRWSFPARNLTGSGLSLATVVVEASETSGARHQAEAALKHGKRVFLVESLVTSQAWAQEMAGNSINATVIADADVIVERLEADLSVDDSFVFA
ncbi:MAG: DNA-processing protein DprA [Acidimicrobiaceae bacterium]|nr:DNA-processing protein DprA [Acidimicrobiaceae bacterium]MXZ66056.1 DNA-processing protein DprA [Acidimicrobiaceae bacterium]MYF33053.1 DNA-processing protein DprA [Acidimicrobiaceae bacterium]MYG79708.1 DNA-processing protein DprA [Acidimicrobiaceae bacterium]MYJ83660.1 DNA-processing protein DprA [Acidimicrobiaceae bacterium]